MLRADKEQNIRKGREKKVGEAKATTFAYGRSLQRKKDTHSVIKSRKKESQLRKDPVG